MLSHGDSDHVGGYGRLAASVPIGRMVANGPVGSHAPDLGCASGLGWEWDGVSFEVLYPFEATPGFDNAHSCVVRIEGAAGSALLTGDIESAAEQALVARLGERLAADVLVVPHHGSATSSTLRFWSRCRRRLRSSAHPGEVGSGCPIRRSCPGTSMRGSRPYSTSRCGAITIAFASDQAPKIARLEREIDRRYWHAGEPPCRDEPRPGS